MTLCTVKVVRHCFDYLETRFFQEIVDFGYGISILKEMVIPLLSPEEDA